MLALTFFHSLTHGAIMAQRLPLIRWRLILFYDKHLCASQVIPAMRPLHSYILIRHHPFIWKRIRV